MKKVLLVTQQLEMRHTLVAKPPLASFIVSNMPLVWYIVSNTSLSCYRHTSKTSLCLACMYLLPLSSCQARPRSDDGMPLRHLFFTCNSKTVSLTATLQRVSRHGEKVHCGRHKKYRSSSLLSKIFYSSIYPNCQAFRAILFHFFSLFQLKSFHS